MWGIEVIRGCDPSAMRSSPRMYFLSSHVKLAGMERLHCCPEYFFWGVITAASHFTLSLYCIFLQEWEEWRAKQCECATEISAPKSWLGSSNPVAPSAVCWYSNYSNVGVQYGYAHNTECIKIIWYNNHFHENNLIFFKSTAINDHFNKGAILSNRILSRCPWRKMYSNLLRSVFSLLHRTIIFQ